MGTLDAIIDSINVTNPDSNSIKYTISGIKEKNKIVHDSKKRFEIKVQYREEVYYQPATITSSLTLTLNFIESFGNFPTCIIKATAVIVDYISNMYSSYASIFSEMIDDEEVLNEQYQVLKGRYPKEYDEMMDGIFPDTD